MFWIIPEALATGKFVTCESFAVKLVFIFPVADSLKTNRRSNQAIIQTNESGSADTPEELPKVTGQPIHAGILPSGFR
jgi:hypothetical protein